jgi:heme A synthase
MCNGEVVPRAPSTAMLIEFSHRVTSGLAFVLVAALCAWAWRPGVRGGSPRAARAPANVRRAATAALVLVSSEALIGAGLVLFELVAHDRSLKRALSMSLHLTNTFFLLAALTLTALWASGAPAVRLRRQGGLPWLLASAFGAVVLVGTSGAVTALGDTLFPGQSHLSANANALLRLGLLHPVLATVCGVFVLVAAAVARALRPSFEVSRASHVLSALVLGQYALGLANIWLSAPVAMQLAHLLTADLVWISLVVLAARALTPRDQVAPSMSSQGPAPKSDVPPSTSSVAPVT